MRIIKYGDANFLRLNKTKPISFKCDLCGCIFEANNTEYKYCGTQIDGDDWKSKCPFCGNEVYSNKRMGW